MSSKSRNLLVGVAVALLATTATAATLSPDLSRQLAVTAAGQQLPVIIQLADRVDLRKFHEAKRSKRDNRLLLSLKDKARQTQGPLAGAIAAQGGARVRQLWIINGIAANLTPAAIERLSKFPGIGRISLDATVSPPATITSSGGSVQWNLTAIHAPDLWTRGLTGSGLVIANMDTGVDPDHPDLIGKWRGGANSWYDPHGQHATPYDANGHGTQTMGLMVGGSASGTAIGVAPDAQWIAAKLFDDAGQATLSDIHLAFQWLLDPDGNPATVDAPDVVNASWGLIGGALGSCNLEFNEDIHTLKTAGVAVVFAAGNDGPVDSTSQSPANNPEGYAAGSVDNQSIISNTSSRGPSGCDSTIYPRIVAPGVNVLTTDLSFGGLPVYATVSGTSFAAPHVAGLMALLSGAFPNATVGDLETALNQSAQDLGPAGADNAYGYGMADGYAAYAVLSAASGNPPAITSTPVTTAYQDQAYSYQPTAVDPDGGTLTFALDTAPSGMTINADTGLINWIPTAAQVGANAVGVRVTDPTGLYSVQNFSVSVVASNRAPISANDSYSVAAGSTLKVAAIGVLANDSDPDGNALTALLKTSTSHGSLSLAGNGSFTYTPVAGYSGTDSFTYAATDGSLTGNTATVTIAVLAANKSPIANNDSYTVAKRRNGAYAPNVLPILANDQDADGSLDLGSVTIVAAPNRGGTVSINGDGTVSYTPKRRFSGTERFKYTVRDNLGAVSNAATVTLTVK